LEHLRLICFNDSVPFCIGCRFAFLAFGLLIAWDRTAAGLIRIAAENVIDPIWFAPSAKVVLDRCIPFDEVESQCISTVPRNSKLV
jgi:hypothetical protein